MSQLCCRGATRDGTRLYMKKAGRYDFQSRLIKLDGIAHTPSSESVTGRPGLLPGGSDPGTSAPGFGVRQIERRSHAAGRFRWLSVAAWRGLDDHPLSRIQGTRKFLRRFLAGRWSSWNRSETVDHESAF